MNRFGHNMKRKAGIVVSSLVFLALFSFVSAANPATVVSEGLVTYQSQYSPQAANEFDARDGQIGTFNQAQLEANSCNTGGDCTSEAYSGIYINTEFASHETVVSVSITYESWGEDGPIQEKDPNDYVMYFRVENKFNSTTYIVEQETTGEGNIVTVNVGDFAPYTNGTLILDLWLYHTDTYTYSNEVNARIHEIWTEKGPSDNDADGVPNSIDQCPSTSNADRENVGENGCLENLSDDDSDGDGVSDENDSCPNTNNGETVNQNGCSSNQLDDDNDTISNANDLCPNTPENENANSVGCSASQRDTDNDGVSDSNDSCPDTESGDEVNSAGCSQSQLSSDDDYDGVPNSSDDCPNTVADATVDSNGCEIVYTDSDGDGYYDEVDDEFPLDGSQWTDSDGDGYGDNSSGFNPDSCVDTFGKSTIDKLGCPDTDQDGYSDSGDAFPQNPTQHSDYDGDGYGDNTTGSDPDLFPEDFTQYQDTDGDGFGDNQTGNKGDICPLTYGTSTTDRLGCLDDDNDGVSNLNDECDNTPDSVDRTEVLANGCVEQNDSFDEPEQLSEDCIGNDCSKSGETTDNIAQRTKDYAKDNYVAIITTILGVTGTAALATLKQKRRGKNAKKFYRLARSAESLAMVVQIRGQIDDMLADGKLDPAVYEKIDKMLTERETFLAQSMQLIVENDNY